MTPPRFQFTIKGMLWATFWLALAFGLFCIKPFTLPQIGSWPFNAELVPIAMVYCVYAACGAAIGKHRIGLLVGISAVLGWLLWYSLIVAYMQWHAPYHTL